MSFFGLTSRRHRVRPLSTREYQRVGSFHQLKFLHALAYQLVTVEK